MNEHEFPILEHDPGDVTALRPEVVLRRLPDMPREVVLCFFRDVIATECTPERSRVVFKLGSEIGPNPVYALRLDDGREVAVIQPGVGAPLAAGFLEELIALGGRRFMVCGGAGVLDGAIARGHVMVPQVAVRDEGTSYHYLPPAREVSVHADAVSAIVRVLMRHNVPYDVVKTWTTDGIYRETRQRIARRRAEGCDCVEMEASALLAVAQYRAVSLGLVLYGGDDVSGEEWDSRDWFRDGSTRQRLFWLAAEAVFDLPEARRA